MRLTRCDECNVEIRDAGIATVAMAIDGRNPVLHDLCSTRCVAAHLPKMAEAVAQQYLREASEREKAERDRIARQQGVQR